MTGIDETAINAIKEVKLRAEKEVAISAEKKIDILCEAEGHIQILPGGNMILDTKEIYENPTTTSTNKSADGHSTPGGNMKKPNVLDKTLQEKKQSNNKKSAMEQVGDTLSDLWNKAGDAASLSLGPSLSPANAEGGVAYSGLTGSFNVKDVLYSIVPFLDKETPDKNEEEE